MGRIDDYMWDDKCPKFIHKAYLALSRWAYLVKDFFYNIRHFFANLWFYRKFLWEDRPWDSAYLYMGMKVKLENMLPAIHGFVGEEERREEMRLCIEILDRLIADEYLTKAESEVTKIYGEAEFKETPEYDEDGKVKYYNVDIVRPNVKTKEDEHKVEKMFHQAVETAESNRQNDLNLLCKTIAEKSRGWWS